MKHTIPQWDNSGALRNKTGSRIYQVRSLTDNMMKGKDQRCNYWWGFGPQTIHRGIAARLWCIRPLHQGTDQKRSRCWDRVLRTTHQGTPSRLACRIEFQGTDGTRSRSLDPGSRKSHQGTLSYLACRIDVGDRDQRRNRCSGCA